MATLSKLFIELGLKKDGLDKGLKDTERSWKSTGEKLQGVGTKMTVGVTAPIIAVGAGLLKVGADADNMADTISLATGATGDELKALTDNALNVFKSIPTDMETAGFAIGELAKNTDATGKTLEDLTATEIRLAEITGTDLGTNIQQTTDIFKNWGVATEDQVGVLDDLLLASQETGTPINELATQVSKFGPTLRGMGLELDESIGWLASLSEAGLDTDKTMAGLTKAFGKFAKEGKDPQLEMSKLLASIAQAPDLMTATQIATEALGSKAGPGLAEAMFTGKLGVEDLMNTLETSDQTVLGMASSTDDASQQFKILKNQVIAAAIPLGTKLFSAINDLMPLFTDLIGWLTKGIDFFTNLPAPVQKVIFILVGLLAVAGPVIGVIGTIITVVGALSAALPVLGIALGIILSPIGLIVLAVAALYLAWTTNFFGFRDITKEVIGEVLDFFTGLVDWFTGGGLSGIIDTIWGVAQSIIDAGVSFLIWYYTLPIEIAKIFIDLVDLAIGFAEDFIGSFTDLPGKIAAPFLGLFNTFFNVGYSIIQGLISGIAALWNVFKGWIDSIIGEVSKVWDYIKPGSPSKTFTIAAESIMDAFTTSFGEKMPELRASVGEVNDTLSGTTPTVSGLTGASAPAGGAMGGNSVVFAEGAIQVNGVTDPETVADRVFMRIERGIGRVMAGEAFA